MEFEEHVGVETPLELIDSEIEDQESSLPTYELLTYPADYTLEVLVDKWSKGQIEIPKFQRGFVWSQVQASKLIESFLLGLPVPPIFLYQEPTQGSLLVVDGQQRLRSIAYFFEGYFGPESAGRRPVFRLKGLHESSPYQNLTYDNLSNDDEAAYNKLNDSVLRALVVKQLNPDDATSIYHIFERLNTGGTSLTAQEIRNCVRHGSLNDHLIEMNQDPSWRRVFGRSAADKRQRDVELVLRFLALYFDLEHYSKPMKNFLNAFMDKFRNSPDDKLREFSRIFLETAQLTLDRLGEKPFHIRAGLNAAVFDAVFTTIGRHRDRLPDDLSTRYDSLVQDPEFLEVVSKSTTNTEAVQGRIARAELFLVQ